VRKAGVLEGKGERGRIFLPENGEKKINLHSRVRTRISTETGGPFPLLRRAGKTVT